MMIINMTALLLWQKIKTKMKYPTKAQYLDGTRPMREVSCQHFLFNVSLRRAQNPTLLGVKNWNPSILNDTIFGKNNFAFRFV